MSEKIKPHHLERKAILYIRQSSAYQVSNNLESQKLQYAMQERLRQLGWRDIDIVDDDLGRSAAGTVTRAGFESCCGCWNMVCSSGGQSARRSPMDAPGIQHSTSDS
jgi:hypothetical protein